MMLDKLAELEQAAASRRPVALVIDGATLAYAMREGNSDEFLQLTKFCEVCALAPCAHGLGHLTQHARPALFRWW
jgi:hypothetical protein